MIELKPCPFCGGEPLFVPNPIGTNNANFNMKGNVGLGELVTYECEECGSDCGLHHNEEEAKIAWNTRYEPTCTWKHTKSGPLYDVWMCCSCGYEYAESRTDRGVDNADFTYCPGCGARIVDGDA